MLSVLTVVVLMIILTAFMDYALYPVPIQNYEIINSFSSEV